MSILGDDLIINKDAEKVCKKLQGPRWTGETMEDKLHL